MNLLEYEITTISPMFASRNGSTFELTSQSVRGVLRFWFRAVIPRILNIHHYDGREENYIGLKKAEELIFGSTKIKSTFDVIIEEIDLQKSRNTDEFAPGRYNKYGIYGVENREFLKENSKIKLIFVIKDEKVKELLNDLLILTSLVSGFGAKSRKGFGSFKINNITNITLNDILNKLDEENKKIFSNDKFELNPTEFNGEVADYPVLVRGYYKSFSINKNNNSFKDVYNYLFRTARNFNQKGIYTKTKLRLRRKGGDSFTSAIHEVERNNGERDIIFHQSILGLPINYKTWDGQHRRLRGSNYTLKPRETDRKASPLFISVHKKNSGYTIRFLVLKSRLTNSDSKLIFQKSRNRIFVKGNENYDELIEELKNNVRG
ncbi:type III-B CRISPR module RAMP protein Cmr1 [Marinitoga aeolica]|uniref:Type III-B CRISPR module RAMP protein Cmr1 n=1 Tax=Marinitoga aeolica TaxID=2809031 RepID=A0ABY8PRA0_9BACT|nr:type III-B CRISPR module RAMP protein Cmr1 [Marinitoga aeolica]WGS65182.1 type III-B CRISPR module RAMP protein Cmr1 [Marinitoga aeolica]